MTRHDSVKLALVGCGGISTLHVNGYRELRAKGGDEVEFAVCCDISQEAANTRADEIEGIQGSRPRVVTDHERLCDSDEVAGAVCCLPHWLHHQIGCALLEGGLHVMIEKPLGITLRAGQKLIDTAVRMGRILATAEGTRRSLGARVCQWAFRDERLVGEPLGARVHTVRHEPFDLDDPAFKWRVVKNLVGGGMILDSGAHFADMMLCLFGEVAEAYCVMQTLDDRRVEGVPVFGTAQVDVEDTWDAVIRFNSGAVVQYSYSNMLPCTDSVFGNYYGTEGRLDDAWAWPMHAFESGGIVTRTDGKSMSVEEITEAYLAQSPQESLNRLFPHGCRDSFGIELWDFADAIANDRSPEMDGHAGQRAKALCETLYESATLGQPVKYADVLSGKVRSYQEPIDEYWGL